MMDRPGAEKAIRDFLIALGHDPEDRELASTPARVASAFMDELLAGRDTDIDALLEAGACGCEKDADGIVVVRDISVSTVCPHHLMPATGLCTVAYLPGSRVAGIGTLARLVHACARRLTLQERIGVEVTSALIRCLGARGAYCALDLRHSCMSARGNREAAATVRTTNVGGVFRERDYRELLTLSLSNPQ